MSMQLHLQEGITGNYMKKPLQKTIIVDFDGIGETQTTRSTLGVKNREHTNNFYFIFRRNLIRSTYQSISYHLIRFARTLLRSQCYDQCRPCLKLRSLFTMRFIDDYIIS